MCDDSFRERGTDAGKRFDLLGSGLVEIDRNRLSALGRVPVDSSDGRVVSARWQFPTWLVARVICRSNGIDAPDLPVQRSRLVRRGLGQLRAPQANAAAGKSDDGKKPEGFFFVRRRH